MKLIPTSYGRRVPLAYILGQTNDNRPQVIGLVIDAEAFERFWRSHLLRIMPKVIMVKAVKRALLTYQG